MSATGSGLYEISGLSLVGFFFFFLINKLTKTKNEKEKTEESNCMQLTAT
jgi:hypothetical protein